MHIYYYKSSFIILFEANIFQFTFMHKKTSTIKKIFIK
jgi:hypothetical protein